MSDERIIDVMIESSRQLTVDVRNLTEAVHELTTATRLQQQSNELVAGRLEHIEDWKDKVDTHMQQISPVIGVVSGIRKAIIAALVASLVGMIGFGLVKANERIPTKKQDIDISITEKQK